MSSASGVRNALALWKKVAGTADADLEALANTFSFTGGQIGEAMAVARNLAQWRGQREDAVTMTIC